jgi:hypothetical protein
VRTLQEAHSSLEPFWGEFADCVQAGWERFMRECETLRPVLSNGAQSTILRDLIVQEFRSRFDGRTGINLWTRGQTFLINVQGQWLIRIKKLSPRSLKASYGNTLQARAFLGQNCIELPNMPDPATHLHLGYALNSMRTAMQGVYFVCPDGSRISWSWTLTAAAQATASSPVTALPVREQPRSGGRVSIKKSESLAPNTSNAANQPT